MRRCAGVREAPAHRAQEACPSTPCSELNAAFLVLPPGLCPQPDPSVSPVEADTSGPTTPLFQQQRVGKEQQGLDTGAPRVLKKERDKLPPYGHLRTGHPVPFKTAPFPTEEPALREMLPRVSPPACSQGCAPKSERRPWACPALSLTSTSASKETSEQRAVSEHLSMLSGGGP